MVFRPFAFAALSLIGVTSLLGCNRAGAPTTTRTTTTTGTIPASPPPNGGQINVEAGENGAVATGRDGNGAVDVEVGPNGGVGVDVQGEPIRERIRERRAARDGTTPR